MESWRDKFIADIDEAINQLKVAKLNYENGKYKEVNKALTSAKRSINQSTNNMVK